MDSWPKSALAYRSVPLGDVAELAAAVVGAAVAASVVSAAAGALVGAGAAAGWVGATAGALVGAAGVAAGPQAARIDKLAAPRHARRSNARRLHNWV